MLRRKTPLRSNPQKTREWKERSRQKLKQTPFKKKHYEFKQRSSKRASQETIYAQRSRAFVLAHHICPVTKGRTCQLHHSAKRSGEWLLLERYWIAVSADGHAWIEANKREAEKLGLMVRIKETYKEHVKQLLEQNKSLVEPIFYLDT